MHYNKKMLALAFGVSIFASPAFAFTQEQVDKGKSEYNTHCRTCHGSNGKGALGPALADAKAKEKWGGKASSDFRSFTFENMPQTAPKSLKDEQLDVLTAYVLSLNGVAPSDKPYAPDEQFPK